MTEEEANAARPAPGEEGIYRPLGLTNGPQSHGLIQMALDYVYADAGRAAGVRGRRDANSFTPISRRTQIILN